MKRSKPFRIVCISVMVLAAALLLWNSWPRTLTSILELESESLTSMAANCVIGDVRNGKAIHDVYTLSRLNPEDPPFTALLSILESTHYCASPVNLLPVSRSSVEGNGGHVTISLTIAAGEEYASLSFLTPRKLSLRSSGKDTFLVYFLTDDTAFSNLQNYLMENGTTE